MFENIIPIFPSRWCIFEVNEIWLYKVEKQKKKNLFKKSHSFNSFQIFILGKEDFQSLSKHELLCNFIYSHQYNDINESYDIAHDRLAG